MPRGPTLIHVSDRNTKFATIPIMLTYKLGKGLSQNYGNLSNARVPKILQHILANGLIGDWYKLLGTAKR